MFNEGLTTALASLHDEKARIDQAIESLEHLLNMPGAARRAAAAPAKRRGRPPASASATKATKAPKGPRKNAPKGLLKAKIHQALAAAKKPLKPVELKDAVVKAGYPVKNDKTLYTQVFAAAKKDPAVQKTAAGYSLKAAAAAGKPASPAAKPAAAPKATAKKK